MAGGGTREVCASRTELFPASDGEIPLRHRPHPHERGGDHAKVALAAEDHVAHLGAHGHAAVRAVLPMLLPMLLPVLLLVFLLVLLTVLLSMLLHAWLAAVRVSGLGLGASERSDRV